MPSFCVVLLCMRVLNLLPVQICSVDIQENGHYPGHMFVIMVIYFLQQTGVLPVLHEVHVNVMI